MHYKNFIDPGRKLFFFFKEEEILNGVSFVVV